MAKDKPEKNTTRKTIDTVENAVTNFSTGVEASQVAIMRKVNAVIRKLEVQGDMIKINRANLKLLRQLREDLATIVLSPAYKKKVEQFLSGFDKVTKINRSYFLSLVPDFNPDKQAFKAIVNSSIQLTSNSLLRAGIEQAVIEPIIGIIQQGITAGMFISDLEDALRLEIIGNPGGRFGGPERQGKLLRYVTQITRDSLNQFSRNYVEAVATEYRLEWYYYDGSIIEDTRTYCKERAGRYFHKKEVEKSANGSWSGRIPSTNRSTIFTYCGGYNCRHEYLPVLIDVVPSTVIRRNERNGNYIPKNKAEPVN